MKELDVVLLLHAYQPPTQTPDVVNRVTNECYRPLVQILRELPFPGCVTMDWSASLLEFLAAEKSTKDVLRSLAQATNKGNVSLVNTAAYHPLLPLIESDDYIARQIALNTEKYRDLKLISANKQCMGVFPPEMAVSPSLFALLRGLSYRWTVTDDVLFWGTDIGNHTTNPPTLWIPHPLPDMACFLRSRHFSNRVSENPIAGDVFAEDLFAHFSRLHPNEDRAYVILAMDAETFGHHHPFGITQFLLPFLWSARRLPIVLRSPDELLSRYPAKPFEIGAGSWATMDRNNPFPLWKDPERQWHQKWWELAHLILDIGEHCALDTATQYAYDRALYSCQPWWHAVNGNINLFLWAIPYFNAVLAQGTPDQQSHGSNLIRILTKG